jgi:DNA-binding response OmpR family regulator
VELYVRRDRLRRRAAARAPASIDADGLLHRGGRWVALPPGELAALTALMSEPGYMVARTDLAAALGMAAEVDQPTRTLDNVVRRVRKRIAPLGMAVCAVRGAGFLLEIGELPV